MHIYSIDNTEVYRAILSFSDSESKITQKTVDSYNRKIAKRIKLKGITGEILPYKEVYKDWSKYRLERISRSHAVIDILYVNMDKNRDTVVMNVLFTLKDNPKVKSKLQRLIKERSMTLCARPARNITFDLCLDTIYTSFPPHQRMKKALKRASRDALVRYFVKYKDMEFSRMVDRLFSKM